MIDFLFTIIIYPITQIIEFVFVFSQKVFKSTGISVLAVSVAISVLTLPLYVVAERWQQIERGTQKRLKPKIDKIKTAFKGDEQYMVLSAYYRQNHYHPIFALRSSFGLLIQIPFFIAAYSYLSQLEALKDASFLVISDLGSPDLLFAPNSIHILPIVMTVINIIAGMIYLRGFALKEKIQLYGMAAVFLVLLYNSPSGLVLYWTLNNVFSLLKNCYYKINFPHKNKILFACLSLLCMGMIYYISFVHKGDPEQRMFIALLAGIIGIAPWLQFLAKKLSFDFSDLIKKENRSLPVFLFSLAVLWILSGLYIPSMLIVSSPQEFSYIDDYTTPLFFIGNIALQTFGFFIFWPMCLYAFFSRKVKKILTLLFLIICFAALSDNFLFPGNYGLISVNLQFEQGIGHPSTLTRLNIVVLLFLVLAFPALFFSRINRFLTPLPALCAAALLGSSTLNLFSIQKSFLQMGEFHTNTKQEITSIEPLFSMSTSGQNVVVIMFDRASSSFFPYILEESPDLKEAYSGFVYYPNTVSFNGYTRIGAPPIFGGYEYTPEEINRRDTVPLVEKHNEALLMMPRIFSEADYTVMVTDPPYPNYSQQEDLRIYDSFSGVQAYVTDSRYTDFWLKEHKIKLPTTSEVLKRDMFWYSLFKISPLAIRRGLYQYGDWCSPISGQKLTSFLNGYSVLDYLPKLTEISGENKNTALIMVNNTTHDGALLQAPDYRPSLYISGYGSSPFNKETEYHINIAAFKRLADWFDFLKISGVYDNTRIIIVSDHGSQISYVTKAPPGMPKNFDNLHPMLLFKDFNASGSLKTDMTFMSNADVPLLALTGLFENPVNPFTGTAITSEAKQKELYIAISGSVHLANPMETKFALSAQEDYYVWDNIFDPKNWRSAAE